MTTTRTPTAVFEAVKQRYRQGDASWRIRRDLKVTQYTLYQARKAVEAEELERARAEERVRWEESHRQLVVTEEELEPLLNRGCWVLRTALSNGKVVVEHVVEGHIPRDEVAS